MTKLSNKCLYALKAVLDLSIYRAGRPSKISEIAKRQNIPSRFLEAILRDLKNEGITDSIRGKQGGYVLAKNPEEISVWDVFKIFSRHDNKESNSLETSSEKELLDTSPIFYYLMQKAEDEAKKILKTTNFSELAQKRILTENNYSI